MIFKFFRCIFSLTIHLEKNYIYVFYSIFLNKVYSASTKNLQNFIETVNHYSNRFF